jgi:hypothetical protein
MSLKFKTIPKQPKDKVQVSLDSSVIGYIDFYPQYHQFLFQPAFETKFNEHSFVEIGAKITELNATLTK